MRFLKLLTAILAVAVATTGRVGLGQSGKSEYRNVDSQLMRKYRDANAYLEKAKTCYGKKDIEGTKKNLDASFGLISEFGDAHLLMAKVHYGEKNYPQALIEVTKAKTGHEATAGLMERMQQDRMSELRKRRQEKDESLTDLRARLARVPPEQQYAIQDQISRLERDKQDIDRIVDAPPVNMSQVPAEYFFLHGNILLRMQRHAEATDQYNEALEINPSYAEAANNLASLYYSTRQYDKAMALATKAEAGGVPFNPDLKKAIESALKPAK